MKHTYKHDNTNKTLEQAIISRARYFFRWKLEDRLKYHPSCDIIRTYQLLVYTGK